MNMNQRLHWVVGVVKTIVTTMVAVTALPLVGLAQSGPGPGPLGPGPGCNFFPPSAVVGAAVDPSYFGPSPSSVNSSLVGPVQLLNTGKIDFEKGTITLPLYKGQMKTGESVWYVLTDTDDLANAKALGLNLSPKLSYSATGVRTGNINSKGEIIFDQGKVDFSPKPEVQKGSNDRPFPPKRAQPGSVGDESYTLAR